MREQESSKVRYRIAMPEDPTTTPPSADAELDLLMPLHFFLGGASGFDVSFIPGAEMPEPFRCLLVHDSDMTSTLSEFHRAEIGLTVRRQEVSADFIMRAVVLDKEGSGGAREPVEFGAIGIRLEPFSEPVREMIRAGERPLGWILKEKGIPHGSHPRGYFRIRVDEHLAELLGAPEGSRLYGRSNVLRDAEGIDFADIVEILPIMEEKPQ